jgi:hypothetical protein
MGTDKDLLSMQSREASQRLLRRRDKERTALLVQGVLLRVRPRQACSAEGERRMTRVQRRRWHMLRGKSWQQRLAIVVEHLRKRERTESPREWYR